MSHGDQPNVMSDGVDATLVAPAGLIYHIIDLGIASMFIVDSITDVECNPPYILSSGAWTCCHFLCRTKEDTAIFISIRPEQRPSLFDHYLILSN
jgi:hypothetical protein